MICAIDIGNTQTKILLIDDKLNIIECVNRSTPDLFEPDSWKKLFDELNETNPLFFLADLKISCVNWRVFLALRVYFKYDPIDFFDTHREFNPDLLILPLNSPLVMESDIPVDRQFIVGLIGTDRLLSAYAAYKIFKRSMHIVSMGTATVVDLITNKGIFFSGVIMPGIDSAYQGLISRANSLPQLNTLSRVDSVLNNNTQDSLYAGSFIAQAYAIEQTILNQHKEAELKTSADIVMTGGRSFSISPHISLPHSILEYLVNFGLVFISKSFNNEYFVDKNDDKLKNIKIIKKNF